MPSPAKESRVTVQQVFKTFFWPRRKIFFIGLILIVISRLSGLALPIGTKFLFDEVIDKGNLDLLKILLTAIGASIIIQALTSFLVTRLLSVEGQYLISVLRARVQKHILRLPTRFFDNSKSGELVSRIMTDVEGVRNLVGTGLAVLVGGILTAIISLALLISISPRMTLFVLVPVGIFAVIALKAFGYIRPIFRERGKLNADVTGRLTETLNGIRVIKGFNAEGQEIKTFERGVEKLFLNVKKSLTSTGLVTSSANFLIGAASLCVMGVGSVMIANDEVSKGELVSFVILIGYVLFPIIQMSDIVSQLTETFAGLDRTEEIMRMTPENDTSVRTINLDTIRGDIEFNNVSFEYEEGKNVLHNISFKAPAGTVTALVGTSGSGKTTIAGLAASFLNPVSGTVTVDGTDLSKVNLDSFRNQLGVVLQDDFLFEGTIRENILFPRPQASEQQLLNAIKAAHVNEFTDRFEKGLDTVIGERGVKLSGGQRQRVAIARAILADPRVLILDEATSNLDTESESYIQESLRNLMKGRTTFVIAHRLSTIRQADQILVIEQGNIFESGKHQELIDKKGRYFELYTYQARI